MNRVAKNVVGEKMIVVGQLGGGIVKLRTGLH